jgi:hypothetical protein
MEAAAGMASALTEFRSDTERLHQELLELISSRTDLINNASSVGMIHKLHY